MSDRNSQPPKTSAKATERAKRADIEAKEQSTEKQPAAKRQGTRSAMPRDPQ